MRWKCTTKQTKYHSNMTGNHGNRLVRDRHNDNDTVPQPFDSRLHFLVSVHVIYGTLPVLLNTAGRMAEFDSRSWSTSPSLLMVKILQIMRFKPSCQGREKWILVFAYKFVLGLS